MVDMDSQVLVEAWIKLHHAPHKSQQWQENFWAFSKLSDLCDDDPQRCWDLVHEIRKADGSDAILANLAAGPLEDLMVRHGSQFIASLEKLAATDGQFRKMLGALWENDINAEVWARIKRVAGPSF